MRQLIISVINTIQLSTSLIYCGEAHSACFLTCSCGVGFQGTHRWFSRLTPRPVGFDICEWLSFLVRQPQLSSEHKSHTRTNKCTAEGPARLLRERDWVSCKISLTYEVAMFVSLRSQWEYRGVKCSRLCKVYKADTYKNKHWHFLMSPFLSYNTFKYNRNNNFATNNDVFKRLTHQSLQVRINISKTKLFYNADNQSVEHLTPGKRGEWRRAIYLPQ